MNSDDSKADNIFCRLISYGPRFDKEGSERTPLEDFSTEVLAWCLRNSQEFRQGFLEILRKSLIRYPIESHTNVAISTQQSFRHQINCSMLGKQAGEGGRFDLVIQSKTQHDFVVVVESKIEDELKQRQVKKYRQELNNGKSFVHSRIKRLVTLTKYRNNIDEIHRWVHGELRWQDVQRILSESHDPSPTNRFVIKHFADFLNDKGIISMQIPKPNHTLSFKRGLSFCFAAQTMLEALGKDLPSQRINGTLKKLPEWREGKKFMCIELRSKPGQPHFSLGINLLPVFSIFAEATWVKRPSATPKKILKRFCKYYEWNDGNSFGLEKRPVHRQWNSTIIEDDLRRIAIIASKLQHGESIEGISLCTV